MGYWTEEEIKILEREFPFYRDCELLQFFPHRTETSICSKARKIGLKKNKFNGAKRHKWTNIENDILINNYNILKYQEIQKKYFPNVSISSIRDQCRKIGIQRKSNKWTQKEDNFLKEKYGKISSHDIVKKINRTLNAIHERIKFLGLSGQGNNALTAGNIWLETEDKILSKLYQSGKTVDEILLILSNKTKCAISNRIHTLGIQKYFNWSKTEDQILIDFYGKERTPLVKNKLPNRAIHSIHRRASILNLKVDPSFAQQIYTHNTNFFRKPTLENSYWAGFIAADGCCRAKTKKNRPKLQIGLSIKDEIIIENFVIAIQYTGPIHHKKGVGNKQAQKYIAIANTEQVNNDLLKFWKITPKKTYTLQPPTSHIQKNLAYAYIIGYIDGDGSISWDKTYKRYCLSIVGTKDLLNWINKEITNIFDNNKPQVNVRQGNGNCFQLAYAGKKNLPKIIKFLKQIPLPFRLSRKWNKIPQHLLDSV